MFCYLVFFLAVLINRIYTKEDKQINGTGRQIQNISCPVSSREKAPDILGDVVVIKMEGVKQTSETLKERQDPAGKLCRMTKPRLRLERGLW